MRRRMIKARVMAYLRLEDVMAKARRHRCWGHDLKLAELPDNPRVRSAQAARVTPRARKEISRVPFVLAMVTWRRPKSINQTSPKTARRTHRLWPREYWLFWRLKRLSPLLFLRQTQKVTKAQLTEDSNEGRSHGGI